MISELRMITAWENKNNKNINILRISITITIEESELLRQMIYIMVEIGYKLQAVCVTMNKSFSGKGRR